MRTITNLAAAASLAAALGACGAAATKPGDLKASPFYDGSLKITATTSAGPASIEISAGILPILADFTNGYFEDGHGLYSHQGPDYPKSQEEAVEVARKAAIPFAELLKQCVANHPDIVVQQPGQTLTEQQLWNNIQVVETCAYEDFGIKPYWIPQLVDDVDVCEVVLGEGWRLPTAADLAAFSDHARQAFADAARVELALNGSMDVYARAADGTLRRGSLEPGVHTLSPIEYPMGYDEPAKYHYEGCGSSLCNSNTLGLRCVRAGQVIP
ncbi:MAG: hypothetical protein QM765_45700 [Myxococcales bacterium]